jgi:enhancing lycopene biosynthesis protein 2
MRIAVLLGGCGHYDGTDVHEAVLTFAALEAAGEKPLVLAPDIPLERTVDHLNGEEAAGETRNVLREAARLSRGPVRPLSEARPGDLEALIIPGGYGPVVNFSTGFARLGEEHRVRPEIEVFVRHFLDAGKPIGLVSVAQILVRQLLGLEIEMAPPPSDPSRPTVDRERRIVHTPGFEGFARLLEVRAGIEAMVGEVLRLMTERGRQVEAARARDSAP